MENNLKKLISEINSLHVENVVNAQRTAENAIIVGVKLHQMKELVPHGEFEKTRMDVIKIKDTTCRNYMHLAFERLVEEKAKRLILSGNSHDGKSATVALLKPGEEPSIPAKYRDEARAEVEKMSWLKLDIKPKDLVRDIQGKDLTKLYRAYEIIRDPKKAGNPAGQQKDIAADLLESGEAAGGMVEDVRKDMLFLAMEDDTTLQEESTARLLKFHDAHRLLGEKLTAILKRRKSAK